MGFGDIINGGYHVGCCELLSTIRERVKPKYHIFGHIHEGILMCKNFKNDKNIQKNLKIQEYGRMNKQSLSMQVPVILDISLQILLLFSIFLYQLDLKKNKK